MTVTCHFISSCGKLKTVLLSCIEVSGSHTVNNLAAELKTIVAKWGIDGKIVAVVSDNAANIVATIRKCGWRFIPCFGHNINLIVQDGIEEISVIKEKATSIVAFFKRSPAQAYAKLHSMQKQMGLKELKLKQEVITRWNSCILMLERLLEVKEALISTLALTNPTLQTFTEEEWTAMEEACQALKIFEEITEEISNQKAVTISKTILLSNTMLKHTQQLKRGFLQVDLQQK